MQYFLSQKVVVDSSLEYFIVYVFCFIYEFGNSNYKIGGVGAVDDRR